ncbi:MAG: hypothetical protein ACI4SQ_04635 [Eubacterium sp.]
MLFFLFFILAFLLLFPDTVCSGAKDGLFLWATVVLPSLFPFCLCTALIRCYTSSSFSKYFLLFAGILSGYPIGAKLSGELYQKGVLSYYDAIFFSSFTNNASPMFVIFFVGSSLLHLGTKSYIFYLLLLLSSLLGSLGSLFVLRKTSKQNFFLPVDKKKKEAGKAPALFDQFDLELNNSAELLIKIGCYILVFSVLTSFIKKMTFWDSLPTSILCGILEITTGNHLLCHSLIDSPEKTALSLAITSFGGLCALAQTNSVIQKNGLSIIWYTGSKLLSAVFAFFLCLFWLRLN